MQLKRLVVVLMLGGMLGLTGCTTLGSAGNVPPVTTEGSLRQDMRLDWWEDYPDVAAKLLVARSFEENKSVQGLLARLDAAAVARASVDIASGPSGSTSVGQSKSFVGSSQSVGESVSAGAVASWALPLFGRKEGNRLLADSDYVEAVWATEAYKQVLAGSVLSEYTRVELDKFRYMVARDNVFLSEQLLEMAKKDLGAGTGTQSSVTSAELAVSKAKQGEVRAMNTALKSRFVLSALLGTNELSVMPMGADGKPLAFKWVDTLPQLVIDDPNMIRNRPDVRRAEALLLKRAGSLKIATADLMPQLSLSFSATNDLKASGSAVSLLGVQLSVPLLDWYLKKQQQVSTSKAFEAQVFDYQDTVLQAWSKIGQAKAEWSVAIGNEELAQKSLEDATRKVRDAMVSYQVGRDSYKEVLQAKLAHSDAKLAYYDAYADRLNAWVKVKQEALETRKVK